MEPERVRVVVPAVGGAFGARVSTYPEHVVVAALARSLARPVRQRDSRSESMQAMSHGRAQVQDVELGATRDGVITDLRARIVADGGAYPGDGVIVVGGTRLMISGPYRIPRVEVHLRLAATNTTPIGAYRGAGVARGDGTMGSRSLQVGGSAVLRAGEQVVEQARQLAAHLLEAPPEDVVVHPGLGVGVAGAPATALSWAELAEAAADPARRPAGPDGGLAAEVDFSMDGS